MHIFLNSVIPGRRVRAWAGVLACLVLGMGCETVEKFPSDMAIAPANATVTPSERSVVFTVYMSTSDDPALPISWSVSNPALGGFTSSSGASAVYRSSGHNGQNVVTATDRDGHVCAATVEQTSESYGLTITASPSSTLTSTQTTCTLTAKGGTPPYKWKLSDNSLGTLTGGSSDTVVYTSSGTAGSNVATVHDANDVSCSISITQSAPEPVPGPGG